MVDLIIYIMIGIVAGILSGLFGIGAGVIIIPALVYLEGFSQLKTQGTSLVALLQPVQFFPNWIRKSSIPITISNI